MSTSEICDHGPRCSSSSGVAALDSIEMLSQYYTIRAYVLGDLCFHIHYDTARGCVFDEDFNLLQVG